MKRGRGILHNTLGQNKTCFVAVSGLISQNGFQPLSVIKHIKSSATSSADQQQGATRLFRPPCRHVCMSAARVFGLVWSGLRKQASSPPPPQGFNPTVHTAHPLSPPSSAPCSIVQRVWWSLPTTSVAASDSKKLPNKFAASSESFGRPDPINHTNRKLLLAGH